MVAATPFCEINRRDDALATYDRALKLEPDLAEAWHGRACALFEINHVTEAFAALDKAIEIKPDFSEAISNRIFMLDFQDNAGFEEQQNARNYWWQNVGSVIAEQSQTHHSNDPDPGRRIKVGYVSADFRSHSAALSFKRMLLNHSKTEFRNYLLLRNPYRRRNNSGFSGCFRSMAERCSSFRRRALQLVQDDQIDILVDLSGYTAGHRLGVFRTQAFAHSSYPGSDRHGTTDNRLCFFAPGDMPRRCTAFILPRNFLIFPPL